MYSKIFHEIFLDLESDNRNRADLNHYLYNLYVCVPPSLQTAYVRSPALFIFYHFFALIVPNIYPTRPLTATLFLKLNLIGSRLGLSNEVLCILAVQVAVKLLEVKFGGTKNPDLKYLYVYLNHTRK